MLHSRTITLHEYMKQKVLKVWSYQKTVPQKVHKVQRVLAVDKVQTDNYTEKSGARKKQEKD